jgi:hypothetical protein
MENGLYTKTDNRKSYVGSCMNLNEAKQIISEIKGKFGWTEIQEIRTGNKVQFYNIAIKLKVK